MTRGRTALLTTLGLAAATVGIAAWAPEAVLAAEFARQRLLAGAQRYAIELGGHRWSYLDAGRPRAARADMRKGSALPAPDKPVIVLVHGFTGSKENWLPLMREMSDTHRLIAPDLPGWGESERKAAADYGASAQVEHLARFLRALPAITGRHEPPALLVGHSMGGQVAGLLAARHPDLVDRLVLMSASGVLFDENEFGRSVLAGDNPFGVGSRAQLHRYLGIVFRQPPMVPWPFDEAMVQRRRDDAAFEQHVLDDIGRGPAAFALQEELPAIRARTLLLWGRDDRVIDPSAVAIFEAGLSDCRTSLLNECGHMPMMEHTRETAMAIKEFLQ
ncbi:MAG TPA: alpha/beta fold hydrolase [Xanthomonadaceae bacterium]|jgi:abhydrolase domain-containing protein 6|nr:alpha/beta fold hydrolase [Xanthomonadaceae bacterium]